MTTLPEQPTIVVVDNGSTDGTAAAVRRRFAAVEVLEPGCNLGAAGRTLGVERLRTPYVAFCDDDTWWDPGSLQRAADVLDQHAELAVVTALIVVEPRGDDDPICQEMQHSLRPPDPALPGPRLISFLAGASVVRRDAYLAAGGFAPELFFGGEEELLAVDLLTAGWELCYDPRLVVHHRPSTSRDRSGVRALGIRNTLWFTWLRRPLRAAVLRTWHVLAVVPWDATTAVALGRALWGLPWVLRCRRVVPPAIERQLTLFDRQQLRSEARRYV